MLETTTRLTALRHTFSAFSHRMLFEFTANYTKTDYDTFKALRAQSLILQVWFGGTVANGVATPTGSDGKYEFKGEAHCIHFGRRCQRGS